MSFPRFIVSTGEWDHRLADDERHVKNVVRGLKARHEIEDIKVFQILSHRDVTKDFVK